MLLSLQCYSYGNNNKKNARSLYLMSLAAFCFGLLEEPSVLFIYLITRVQPHGNHATRHGKTDPI